MQRRRGCYVYSAHKIFLYLPNQQFQGGYPSLVALIQLKQIYGWTNNQITQRIWPWLSHALRLKKTISQRCKGIFKKKNPYESDISLRVFGHSQFQSSAYKFKWRKCREEKRGFGFVRPKVPLQNTCVFLVWLLFSCWIILFFYFHSAHVHKVVLERKVCSVETNWTAQAVLSFKQKAYYSQQGNSHLS